MSKPVWVQVLWSESGEFKDNELMPFVKFEGRAKRVAMKHTTDGYYKTKVNVLFDDGNNYICRLDLAPNDTLGFKDHCKQLISWYERQEDDWPEQDYAVQAYKRSYEFLKQVDWNDAA